MRGGDANIIIETDNNGFDYCEETLESAQNARLSAYKCVSGPSVVPKTRISESSCPHPPSPLSKDDQLRTASLPLHDPRRDRPEPLRRPQQRRPQLGIFCPMLPVLESNSGAGRLESRAAARSSVWARLRSIEICFLGRSRSTERGRARARFYMLLNSGRLTGCVWGEQKPLMEYGQPDYEHFADTCPSMGPGPDGGAWAC